MNFLELNCRLEKIKDLTSSFDPYCGEFSDNFEKFNLGIIAIFTIKPRFRDINFAVINDLSEYGYITFCTDDLLRLEVSGTKIIEFFNDMCDYYETQYTIWGQDAYLKTIYDYNIALKNSILNYLKNMYDKNYIKKKYNFK